MEIVVQLRMNSYHITTIASNYPVLHHHIMTMLPGGENEDGEKHRAPNGPKHCLYHSAAWFRQMLTLSNGKPRVLDREKAWTRAYEDGCKIQLFEGVEAQERHTSANL